MIQDIEEVFMKIITDNIGLLSEALTDEMINDIVDFTLDLSRYEGNRFEIKESVKARIKECQ